MPWLHLLFDAWEDYSEARERETQKRAAEESVMAESAPSDDSKVSKKKTQAPQA